MPEHPLPTFSNPRPILDHDALRYNPTHEWIFHSPIELGPRLGDKALGRWYMYYSPHDKPAGICLATADSITGPWREHPDNPIISRSWPPHYEVSHVASPHPIWAEDEGKLLLYFHGENSATRCASSTDGIHFEYESLCVTADDFDGNSESSYARVFEHALPGKDNRYIMLLMGNCSGTRNLHLAWSKDGRNWETRRSPLIAPPALPDAQTSGPFLLKRDGRTFVLHHVGSKPDPQEPIKADLYITEVSESLEPIGPSQIFYKATPGAPDHGRAADPVLVEEDGKPYMLYIAGRRLEGRMMILDAEGN